MVSYPTKFLLVSACDTKRAANVHDMQRPCCFRAIRGRSTIEFGRVERQKPDRQARDVAARGIRRASVMLPSLRRIASNSAYSRWRRQSQSMTFTTVRRLWLRANLTPLISSGSSSRTCAAPPERASETIKTFCQRHQRFSCLLIAD
jgi:hypothetical protein